MSHFNVSLIVWAKSQDSVHKPPFLKRRERRDEADRTNIYKGTARDWLMTSCKQFLSDDWSLFPADRFCCLARDWLMTSRDQFLV